MSARRVESSAQASPRDWSSWLDLARRCEDVDARALLVSDHPGTGPSPFVALADAGAVTSTHARRDLLTLTQKHPWAALAHDGLAALRAFPAPG